MSSIIAYMDLDLQVPNPAPLHHISSQGAAGTEKHFKWHMNLDYTFCLFIIIFTSDAVFTVPHFTIQAPAT